jgi:hypothetical protein
MNGAGDDHVKWAMLSSERQILHFHSYAESRPTKWYDMIIKEGLLCGGGAEGQVPRVCLNCFLFPSGTGYNLAVSDILPV